MSIIQALREKGIVDVFYSEQGKCVIMRDIDGTNEMVLDLESLSELMDELNNLSDTLYDLRRL